MISNTLLILKPDALDRGLVGEITERFILNNFHIVSMNYLIVTEQHIRQHYAPHIEAHGEEIAERILDFFVGRPVLPFIILGEDAIKRSRKLIGTSDPALSPSGTIRGDFGDDSYYQADMDKRSCRNLIHGSDSPSEFKREVKIWFPTYKIKEQ
ncbi:nucleoside-diphosphate kinase [Paenibacillus illinoisensis]|uniref:nucleoside-diphosphate kinase n=1 Tax=Paenibacillus illinoisensis TaxID=59845 RepID=UPI003019AA2A